MIQRFKITFVDGDKRASKHITFCALPPDTLPVSYCPFPVQEREGKVFRWKNISDEEGDIYHLEPEGGMPFHTPGPDRPVD